MPNIAIEAIGAIIAMGLIGSFVLIGMRMRFKHTENRLSAGGSEEIDRLTEAVEALTDHFEQLNSETADLQERVDFAERLLTKPAESEPISTPV